jgi:Domain of unknown function (DUF927)
MTSDWSEEKSAFDDDEPKDEGKKPKTKKPGNRKTTWPFRLTKKGVEHLVETKDPESGEPTSEWRWICSYLDVAALTRSVDGEDWGRLLIIQDSDDRLHEWAMPMAMLAWVRRRRARPIAVFGAIVIVGAQCPQRAQ